MMNTSQAAIVHANAFKSGAKSAAIVCHPQSSSSSSAKSVRTYYVGRVLILSSFHSRALFRPPLHRMGSVIHRLQTNVIPEPFTRSFLLPLPTRAICELSAIQPMDQEHKWDDGPQVDR